MSAVTCRILGPDDAAVLDDVAEGVFDGPTVPAWTAATLAEPSHIVAVAVGGGQVVGFVTALVVRHPDKAPQLWINEVGVADALQRRGIGRALFRVVFRAARRAGCVEAWVAADPGAHAFYRALGGEEESGRTHFGWPLDAHD